MNNLRHLIMIAVLSLSTTSIAQGYMGKRFSISYQPGYSFAAGYYQIPFMLHHRANVGFALSDHWTINANFLHAETKLLDENDPGVNPPNQYQKYRIHDLGVGLSVLYFRKIHQSYAPIGRYLGLGVDFGQQNSRWEIFYQNESNYPEKDEFYTDENRTSMVIISATFGRNFLIKEQFLLGYGIQWGFVVGPYQPQRHLGKPFFNIGYIF